MEVEEEEGWKSWNGHIKIITKQTSHLPHLTVKHCTADSSLRPAAAG